MKTDEGEKEEPSVTFLVSSGLGMLGLGMIGGVWRVFKQENIQFDPKAHRQAAKVAAKALFYGTVLCFGTFGLGLGVFMGVTGITSMKQFDRAGRDIMEKVDFVQNKDPEYLKDKEMLEKMTMQEEADFWNKIFEDALKAEEEKEKSAEAEKALLKLLNGEKGGNELEKLD